MTLLRGDILPMTTKPMSSGCIRIEKPFELAELLLADSPE